MTLQAGARLGPYEVVSLLGSGGMGEVYRAKDTKLGREVAIKVLPDVFANDPERLSRLHREAQVLASLNHPNIAHIHGYEESNGTHGLVMELVEGATLADRIARGPVPLAEALPIARQIAEALEAAHEQGIVHRDLKPANIKVREDGTVKVLDFGLAKLVDSATAGSNTNLNATASPTITTPAMMTGVGVILGTAAYMAPEQARGSSVDRRADIWAFGCVLYEMLTRTRVFRGDHVSDVLAAVLRAEPDWQALPATTPASIRRVLRRALVKDRRDRLADMTTVRLEIGDAMSGVRDGERDAAIAPTAGAARRSRLWLALAAAVSAVALAGVGTYRLRPTPVERPMHFAILPPDGTSFASVATGGAPAVSPDGRQIAFVAEGTAGRQLWVRSVDAFDPRPLPGTEAATGPFWSPDGRWLAFVAGGTLKKVGLTGEQPQALARANVSAFGPFAGAWTADGRILFYGAGNTLSAVPASGGDATPFTARNIELFDENHWGPALLPDGHHYLLLVRGGAELDLQLKIGMLESNDRITILKGVTTAQYAPSRTASSGRVLFVRDGKLMAQPLDVERGSLSGTPVTIAEGIAVAGGGALADFSVSPAGVLAYRRAASANQELVWFDRAGKQVGAIGDRPGNPRNNLRLSPDGKAAAFTRQGETALDIWIGDLATGALSRFTLNGGRSPVWSPDGAFIAFLRQDTIYRKPVRGAGEEVAVWSGPGIMSVNDWSGDGRYLLITRWDPKAGLDGRGVWLLPEPLVESAKHDPSLLESPGIHPQFVPAVGRPRWVSIDRGDVIVRTMPGEAPGKWQLSTDGANGSRWRRDGRELYLTSSQYGTLAAVDVDPDHDFQHGAVHPLFPLPRAVALAVGQYAPGYDVSADGQRFLSTFPARDEPSTTIDIVVNWQGR